MSAASRTEVIRMSKNGEKSRGDLYARITDRIIVEPKRVLIVEFKTDRTAGIDCMGAVNGNCTPVSISTTNDPDGTPGGTRGMPGGFLSLSANGNAAGSGIVWALHPYSGDANNAVVPNTAFTWSTSNPAIASVTATSATTARVVGTGVGRVTITATPTRGGAGASAVTVNPGNFILFDDFSGTDATALAAHAPTVNLVAAAWAVTGSPVPFLSAQTAAVTGGSSTVTAMTDAGIPDVLVETDWSPGSNPAGGMSNGALVFRRTDANNYFMLQWSNGRLILWRVAAGAWTNRWQANFDSSILTGTHHLSAQATGSSIQVMWDRGVYIGNMTGYDAGG